MDHGMLSYTVSTYCYIMLQCIKIYQMNSNDTYVVLCLQYIWVNWNVSVALRTLKYGILHLDLVTIVPKSKN